MSSGGEISIEIETKAVAMMARGDLMQDIAKELNINPNSVTNIKKRNKANLAIIADKMLTKATEDAMAIKQKANTKISKRLVRDDKITAVLDKAYDDYIEDTINLKEYSEIIRKTKELSIAELVSISKTMHDQSAEKEAPQATQADLAALAAAIRSGDEVKITQAVFNGRDN